MTDAEGLDVRFGGLSERPTIADWWALLGGRAVPDPAGDVRADIDLSAPFELSPVQRACWAGRFDGQVLGGVGRHVYLEVDGSGVDAERVHWAVLAVAARHP